MRSVCLSACLSVCLSVWLAGWQVAEQAAQEVFRLEVKMGAMEERLERFKGFNPPPKPKVVKPKAPPKPKAANGGAVESLDGLMGGMSMGGGGGGGGGGGRPTPPSSAKKPSGGGRAGRGAAAAAAANASGSGKGAAAAEYNETETGSISRAECDALFKLIDKDGDGGLTRREIKKGLKDINKHGKAHGLSGKLVKSAKQVFDVADDDGSKRIDEDEFYEFMASAVKHGAQVSGHHTGGGGKGDSPPKQKSDKLKEKQVDRAIAGNLRETANPGDELPPLTPTGKAGGGGGKKGKASKKKKGGGK
eukprot:SAG22_NODE_114_length_19318_cov_13.809980_4_plen_305_part_00